MASDILNGLSPNELSKEVVRLVSEDQRGLPMKSKVFAAIAKLQKFDVLPEVCGFNEINKAIQAGGVELNRGLSATKGVPSMFYAKELLFGSLYPGTLSAFGNGIYFAVPSKEDPTYFPGFPKISIVALKYTSSETPGVVVRAVLRKGSKIANCDDLKDDLRENRNRAKRAGINDLGAFAAALGFDAFFADYVYDDTDERVYTVLNRGTLSLQNQAALVNK
jgi:hypothetical protein